MVKSKQTGIPTRWFPILAMLFATCGCESRMETQLRQYREQFLANSEPASPTTIEQAIKEVADRPEVTVMGRINAGKSDPFDKGQATLIMGEMPDPSHGHAPDDDCPFCRRKLEESQHCIVRFLDKAGNVITHSTPDLFGVSKDQDVVVQGRGTMLSDLGILQVDATTIFIKPKK
jgi:hypothetical protein